MICRKTGYVIIMYYTPMGTSVNPTCPKPLRFMGRAIPLADLSHVFIPSPPVCSRHKWNVFEYDTKHQWNIYISILHFLATCPWQWKRTACACETYVARGTYRIFNGMQVCLEQLHCYYVIDELNVRKTPLPIDTFNYTAQFSGVIRCGCYKPPQMAFNSLIITQFAFISLWPVYICSHPDILKALG